MTSTGTTSGSGSCSPPSRKAATLFDRGLSDGLMRWLSTQAGQALRSAFAAHELDVRLRGDYLNAYRAGCSVAKVQWQPRNRRAVVVVHRKYLVHAPALLEGIGGGHYQTLPASTELVLSYIAALPGILRAVEQYIGEEGRWEERCVRANLEGTPIIVIDRQIVDGRPQVKLDLLAVATAADGAKLVAIELKRDLDNRIQDVPMQALKYVKMLDPTGSGLRADVAASYVAVCSQLRALGFSACDPALIRPSMPVVGLVALAAYNPRSQLLGRARQAARGLDRPIRFCQLDGDHLTLPPEAEWFD